MAQYSSIEHMIKAEINIAINEVPGMPVFLRREVVAHNKTGNTFFVYTKTSSRAEHCKDRLPVILHYYTIAYFSYKYEFVRNGVITIFAALDNKTHQIVNNSNVVLSTLDILCQQDQDEVFELFDPPIFCREIEIEIREAKNNLINA